MAPGYQLSSEGDHQARLALGRRLVTLLEQACLGSADPWVSLDLAGRAAGTAWNCHPGSFASVALERRLEALGRERVAGGPRAGLFQGGRPKVLHVLSEAYPTGGHTRLAREWMTQDEGREHAVVVTRQRDPQGLAFLSQEGRYRVLDLGGETAPGPDRFQALAGAMRASDWVVFHIHPDDALAVAVAYGIQDERRLLFVNHADHVFWLGAGLRAHFLNLRGSGLRLSRDQRGIPASNLGILPIPVAPPQPNLSRTEARAQLGLPPGVPVVLTVASAYKFTRVGTWGFADLVAPLVEHPEARVCLVGPGEDHPEVQRMRRLLGDRVRAFGLQRHLEPFRAAADIYLDSFPFPSLTASLESLIRGTAYHSLNPYSGAMEILGADYPGLAGEDYMARDLAQSHAKVSRLLRDPEHRAAQGRAMAEGTRCHHGDDWRAAVEAAYSAPAPLPGDLQPSAPEPTRLALSAQETVNPFAAFPQRVARGLGLRGFTAWAGARVTWKLRRALKQR